MTRGFLDDDDRALRSDLVDIALYLHHETAKAWLLSETGDPARAEWLAKSQAEGSGGVWTMPEWVARKRGWM